MLNVHQGPVVGLHPMFGHDSIILDDAGKPDPRYINVSVDQTQFRPVLFGDVVSQITR